MDNIEVAHYMYDGSISGKISGNFSEFVRPGPTGSQERFLKGSHEFVCTEVEAGDG